MSNYQQDIDDLFKVPKNRVVRKEHRPLKKAKVVDNVETIATLSDRITVLERELRSLTLIASANNMKFKHLTDKVNDVQHSNRKG